MSIATWKITLQLYCSAVMAENAHGCFCVCVCICQPCDLRSSVSLHCRFCDSNPFIIWASGALAITHTHTCNHTHASTGKNSHTNYFLNFFSLPLCAIYPLCSLCWSFFFLVFLVFLSVTFLSFVFNVLLWLFFPPSSSIHPKYPFQLSCSSYLPAFLHFFINNLLTEHNMHYHINKFSWKSWQHMLLAGGYLKKEMKNDHFRIIKPRVINIFKVK